MKNYAQVYVKSSFEAAEMYCKGVNVVRLLLINLECVGGLQFNKQYKYYLQKGKSVM